MLWPPPAAAAKSLAGAIFTISAAVKSLSQTVFHRPSRRKNPGEYRRVLPLPAFCSGKNMAKKVQLSGKT
jgi:hypothetical protein